MAPSSGTERQGRAAAKQPGRAEAKQQGRIAARRPGAKAPGAGGAGRPAVRARADPARRAALDVLLAVEQRDAYANLLLPSVLTERGLAGRDAALATELTYGTLRGRGTYDAILGVCSDRGLDRIDPPLREALRLGIHQLLATRVRAHAAVATSVDLAKDVAGPRSAGFVNAVLRRVATRDLETWISVAAPSRAADPLGHLVVRYSHPRWIVAALSESLGESPGDNAAGGLAETEAALAADSTRPGVTLCVVPGLADAAELVAAGAEPARWSPFGGYLDGGDPAAVTVVAEGRAAVQDEASQLVALALARAGVTGRDTRWLDLCAGPGGKARLLAGWRPAARPGWSPPTSACTGPGWPVPRSPAPVLPPRSPPTVRSRRGGPEPSTGFSPTSRARGLARCAAAPRHAGASHPRTSPAWVSSSGGCSHRRWTPLGREVWSAT